MVPQPTTSESVLLFLHIPKTAGTTLSKLIYQHYASDTLTQTDNAEGFLWNGVFYLPFGFYGPEYGYDAVRVPTIKHVVANRLDELRAIQGHFSFGLHEWLRRPSFYITVLRDPVDRVISLYYHTLKWSNNPLHHRLVSEKISLEEFVAGISCRAADNDQTRRISGMNPEFGQCSAAMLERAKANLRTYFPVVGLTERFEETLILFKRALGWKYVYNGRYNTNKGRPTKNSLPPGTLDLIMKHNELDIQLYRYAEAMLDEMISAQGPEFEEEVNALRNRMLSSETVK